MHIPHPHLCILRVKVLCQLVFLCVLLTSITGAQEADSKKVSSLIDQLKHSDSHLRFRAVSAFCDAMFRP